MCVFICVYCVWIFVYREQQSIQTFNGKASAGGAKIRIKEGLFFGPLLLVICSRKRKGLSSTYNQKNAYIRPLVIPHIK